jgi:hypothetical protein
VPSARLIGDLVRIDAGQRAEIVLSSHEQGARPPALNCVVAARLQRICDRAVTPLTLVVKLETILLNSKIGRGEGTLFELREGTPGRPPRPHQDPSRPV